MSMDPNAALWSQSLQHAARTDQGLRRANNQDSFVVALAANEETLRTRGHLFMVADGMGAHAAGELASKMATDLVPLTYYKLRERPIGEALAESFTDANRQIHARGQASADFRGMGTTGSLLALAADGAHVAHVGDSRVYRLRGTQIDQWTFDHSLVWEVKASGQFSANQYPLAVSKNIITRSLGPNPRVQVDVEGPFEVDAGDTFLLCSDGLSGQVPDDELGVILALFPPDEAAAALVHLANLRGGPDNVTLIVVKSLVALRPEAQNSAAPSLAPSAKAASKAAAPASAGTAAKPASATPGARDAARPAGGTRRIPLWLWGWGTLSFGAAAVLAALGLWGPALLAGGSMFAAAVVALMTAGGGEAAELAPNISRRAPYVSVNCAASADLAARFQEIAAQLRQAADDEGWTVDHEAFRALSDRAAAAAGQERFGDAVRNYVRAIVLMMDELKARAPRVESPLLD